MTAPRQGRLRTTTGRYGRAWPDAARSAQAQLARGPQDPRVDATRMRRKAVPGGKQSHQELTSGGEPHKGRDRDAASRCTARQRQEKGCALSCRDCAGGQDRPTPVTRTSTHTGSALVESARSLRRTICRVNRGKTLARGIKRFFSQGSGMSPAARRRRPRARRGRPKRGGQLAVASSRSRTERLWPRVLPCSYSESAISWARIGSTDSRVSLRPWLAWLKPCM